MRLELFFPKKEDVRVLGEVKSPAILSINKTTFHDDGLYSSRIFGAVGSKERMRLFGYIDLKIDIIHPLIWNDLMSLKGLYLKVVQGKAFAVFDKERKDLVLSNNEEGFTGYHWFLEQLPKIRFEDNNSTERADKISVVKKNINNMMERYLFIIPAGLREYQLENNPNGEEHEINDLYRKVLNSKSLIENINVNVVDPSSIDAFRYRIQTTVNDLYDYIIGLSDGKDKFINSSWTKRGIDFGTRSVISALPLNVTDLDEVDDTINQTVSGIYIILKSITPFILNSIDNLFFSTVINKDTNTIRVLENGAFVHKQTSSKEIDKWVTMKGLEDILTEIYSDEFKNTIVTIDNQPVIYVRDTEDTIEVINDLFEVDVKELRPITYGELFYISILPLQDEIYPIITRFPIDSEGSIYTSKLKLVTTLPDRHHEVKVIINDNEFVVNNYPIIGGTWSNILSPNVSRWGGLGSDNDGDKVSVHIPFSTNAKEENKQKIESTTFYIKPDGNPYFELSNTINEGVMSYITSDMEK